MSSLYFFYKYHLFTPYRRKATALCTQQRKTKHKMPLSLVIYRPITYKFLDTALSCQTKKYPQSKDQRVASVPFQDWLANNTLTLRRQTMRLY